jgi:hypothetical protein
MEERNAAVRDTRDTISSSVLACILETSLLEALSESGSLAELSHRSGILAPLVEGLLDVLVALGFLLRTDDGYRSTPDLLPLLLFPARDALLADVRTVYLQSRATIDAAKRRTLLAGWSHTDPELLAAADFARTQIVAGPPGSIPKLIVGQRPPS